MGPHARGDGVTLPYLIWLDAVQQPIEQGMLYDEDTHDDMVMKVTRVRARDELPHLEVELDNPGWAIWETGQSRYCALVESDDGTLATTRVLGRGTVRSLPPSVSGQTITLDVECSPDPDALATAKEAAAAAVLGVPIPSEYDEDGTLSDTDPTAEQLPYLDWLFGRPERLADALPLTRHEYWHYDPVTHAPTWRMHQERRRLLNVGDAYDPESLQASPGKGAIREVRCRLVSAFQIQATGDCDIGPWIGNLTSLTGYGGKGDGSLSANAGWSLGTPQVRTIKGETGDLATGRVWQITYRRVYYVQTPIAGSNPPQTTTNTRYGNQFKLTHREYVNLKTEDTYFNSWLARYTYSQPVREIARIVLRGPVQPGATAAVDYVDLGDVTIGDPHAIVGLSGLAPLEADKEYAKGDAVLVGGEVFRAAVDGLRGGDFWVTKRTGRYSLGRYVTERNPLWEPVPFTPPLADPAAVEFLPTPRGLACLASQALRMAVVWLDRLQSWGVTVTCQREDVLALTAGIDLDLVDAIRVLLPGRQDSDEMKPAVGYLMRVEETWSGEGDTVTLTLAVPTGTGLNEVARAAAAGRYGAEDMADAEYLEQGTAHLTAGPDIEWNVDGEPLKIGVIPSALSDPAYSLGGNYTKRNQAPEQLGTWKRLAAAQGHPPDAVDELGDTLVEVLMRPLVSEPVTDRLFSVTADMVRSPRGIRLTETGEP